MVRTSWHRRLGLFLGFVFVVAAPGTAARAQDGGGSISVPSRQPAVIKSQLRLASDLGHKVLLSLANAPTDDSIPLDESLHKAARDTYVMIRAARHGMILTKEWNEGRKNVLPDPMMDLAYKRVDDAWNLSRTPVDAWSNLGLGRQEYLRRSIEDLGRAMRLVDQALVLLP